MKKFKESHGYYKTPLGKASTRENTEYTTVYRYDGPTGQPFNLWLKSNANCAGGHMEALVEICLADGNLSSVSFRTDSMSEEAIISNARMLYLMLANKTLIQDL